MGISACLLGEHVRHDGGHKLAAGLRAALDAHVVWVPVCPEVESGMDTPRETLRLEGHGAGARPRLIAPGSGTDWTDRMHAWAVARLDMFAADGLHGFVLKARSPSCGLRDAALHAADGRVLDPRGRGLFAAALAQRFPGLPIEDEERLADAAACERFVARVPALRRR